MLKNCIHCRIECADLRDHTKSEWHVYNLRREAVGLCPISEQDFRTKQNDLIKKSVITVTPDRSCCGKVYKSTSTLENHLKSKKHCEKSRDKREKMIERDEREMEEEMEEEMESFEDLEEELESEEEEEEVLTPLKPGDCLFCSAQLGSMDASVSHMKDKHGFSLPYEDCVADLDGLVEYLMCLVDEHNVCLLCNRQFDGRRAVRNHMLHAGHMRLYFHLETHGDDLSEFYGDLPAPVLDLTKLTDELDVEARLPNGKRVGHRQMKVYFDQNLNGLSTVNKDMLAICSGVDKARMSVVQCGRPSAGALVSAVVTQQQKKFRTLEARYAQLRSSRFSNFQKHFRQQILM